MSAAALSAGGLLAAVRSALAPAMQAYMKSAMPFHGVATPLRRRVVGTAVLAHPLADAQSLIDTVMPLWRGATRREERYGALDLLRLPRHQKWIDLALLPLLPLLHEMLLSGAWWDHNDEISGLALGLLLQRHPDTMKPLLRGWARSDNLWLRRAAMLCQRRLKQNFDAVLLYDCILPSVGESAMAKQFFIRRGISWALRERSYAAPDEVRAFCAEYHAQLSPLTRREALRVVDKRAR